MYQPLHVNDFFTIMALDLGVIHDDDLEGSSKP